MASQQGTSTRVHPGAPAPPPPPASGGDGLSLTTLLVSAVASAVSAYVTSKIWAAGTLYSAAMSPVIVALVKEGLRKPTDLVASAVPAPRLRSWSAREAPLPDDLPDRLDGGAPLPFPPPVAHAPEGPVRIYSTRGRRLRWRLALVTGLLGFVVCALVYTVPEVIAGRSVVHAGSQTTLWGGSRHHHRSSRTTTTRTTTTRTTTTPAAGSQPTTTAPVRQQPARTVTAPAQTVTVPAPAVTTPAPTATTPQQGVATTPQQAPAGGASTAPQATPSG